MAITKEIKTDFEVLTSGAIQVKATTCIMEEGECISTSLHRGVISLEMGDPEVSYKEIELDAFVTNYEDSLATLVGKLSTEQKSAITELAELIK